MKLFFAGDFCSKPSSSGISISDDLKALISSCDINVLNFEVPLRPDNSDKFHHARERFYQHDDVPAFLSGIGFNLFSLANNHAFDWGDDGYLKTKEALGDNAFGSGTYDEAYRVKVIENKGVKIGFLGCTFASYRGVFDDVLRHNGLGCAYINDLRMNHAIIDARKKVDFLFVLPHDGIEYIDVPLPETMARYRDFIDYGADGVIATHPHCPQGWEEYKGKPIFYSLGNFLFNSKDGYDYRALNRPHWYEGLCVVMDISDGKIAWEVVNTINMGNKAIEIDISEDRDKHNAQLCRYLSDDEEYWKCFSGICEEMGYRNEMSIIDRTLHSFSLKASSKALFRLFFNSLRKKEICDDYSLQRLLTHDLRRLLLLRSIKVHHKRD